VIKRKKIEDKLTNEKTGIRKGYRQTSEMLKRKPKGTRQSVFEMKREFQQSKTSKSPKEMLGDMNSYYKDLMK